MSWFLNLPLFPPSLLAFHPPSHNCGQLEQIQRIEIAVLDANVEIGELKDKLRVATEDARFAKSKVAVLEGPHGAVASACVRYFFYDVGTVALPAVLDWGMMRERERGTEVVDSIHKAIGRPPPCGAQGLKWRPPVALRRAKPTTWMR